MSSLSDIKRHRKSDQPFASRQASTLTQYTLWGAIFLVISSTLLSAIALTSLIINRFRESELRGVAHALHSVRADARWQIDSTQRAFIEWRQRGADVIERGQYLSPAHPLGHSLSSPPLLESFAENNTPTVIINPLRREFRLSSLLLGPQYFELSFPLDDQTLSIIDHHPPRQILRVRYPSFFTELGHVLRRQGWILFTQSVILTLFALYMINRALILPIKRLTDQARALPRDQEVSLDKVAIEGEETQWLKSAPAELMSLQETFTAVRSELRADRRALAAAYQRLAQQERHVTSEYLGAKVMHEMGNPLASVMGLIDYVRCEEDAAVRDELLGLAYRELLRMREISRGLLRTSSVVQERWRLEDLIDWLTLMLRHHDRYVALELIVTGSVERELVFPSDIIQLAVLNVVLNGARAQGGQGHIWLHIDQERLQEREMMVLYITDQGKGVREEFINDLFVPWVSDVDEGIGLGLAITRSSLGQHEGVIEYLAPSSESGERLRPFYEAGESTLSFEGACFVIRFPASSLT